MEEDLQKTLVKLITESCNKLIGCLANKKNREVIRQMVFRQMDDWCYRGMGKKVNGEYEVECGKCLQKGMVKVKSVEEEFVDCCTCLGTRRISGDACKFCGGSGGKVKNPSFDPGTIEFKFVDEQGNDWIIYENDFIHLACLRNVNE